MYRQLVVVGVASCLAGPFLVSCGLENASQEAVDVRPEDAGSAALRSPDNFELPVYKWVELPNLFDIPDYRHLSIPVFKSEGHLGPGVLLVHGNSLSSRTYVHQVFGVLGEVLKIYLVDMPGFGRSEKVEAGLPLPTDELGVPVGFPEYQIGMMESVYVVASDPELAPTIFVGWSLGGDILLLARGAGLLPNAEGLMIFGTAPAGANPPTTEAPFMGPNVPGATLSVLLSFALAFELDATAPLGFTFNGDFADPVPAYAPPPISDAPNIGEAFIRAMFDEEQRLSGDVPAFFLEDAFDRADARARGSIGVAALGLLPPGTLPDELEALGQLAGDSASPDDDIPIAVLAGEEDAIVNRQYLRALASEGAIPTLWTGHVLEIPGAGHAIQYERPLLFNALLGLFVADVAYD